MAIVARDKARKPKVGERLHQIGLLTPTLAPINFSGLPTLISGGVAYRPSPPSPKRPSRLLMSSLIYSDSDMLDEFFEFVERPLSERYRVAYDAALEKLKNRLLNFDAIRMFIAQRCVEEKLVELPEGLWSTLL